MMLVSPMVFLVARLMAGADSLPNAVVVADTGKMEVARPSSPTVPVKPVASEIPKSTQFDPEVSVEERVSESVKSALSGNATEGDLAKHNDSSVRARVDRAGLSHPSSRPSEEFVVVPQKESEREYWWIPFAQEQEIKLSVRRYDSIEHYVRGRTPVNIDLDQVGLRLLDGWYRLRMGVAHAEGPRLWRLVFGGGVKRQVVNSTLDSVRGRELTSGYEIRLWEERIAKGPGPVSFYFGFGPNIRWEFAEGTLDSSQLGTVLAKHRTWVSGDYVNGQYVPGYYKNDYHPTNASSRSWAGAVLIGVGARIHTETGMALVGGMELGPEYREASLSGDSLSVSGSASKWSLLEPTWTVGVDWFF